MEQEAVNWWPLSKTGTPEGSAFVNLDLVQTVEFVSGGAIRLRFRENETITVEGSEATELLKYLATITIRKPPSV
jgi:hypothetical protein